MDSFVPHYNLPPSNVEINEITSITTVQNKHSEVSKTLLGNLTPKNTQRNSLTALRAF